MDTIENISSLPKNAVLLEEDAALTLRWQLIMSWNNKYDVWPYRYGMAAMAITSATTGFYINNIYRHRLHLGRVGHFASFLPVVFLPSCFSALFHTTQVINEILLQKVKCRTCHQMKSATFQMMFGVGYPMLFAPIANFMLADRFGTYRLPSLKQKPKDLLVIFFKITRYMKTPLLVAATLQAAVASVLTFLEMRTFDLVDQKLKELDTQ